MNERDAENLETLRRSIRETDVVSTIRDYLVTIGAVVIRINSGAVKDGDRYTAFNRWWAGGLDGETAGVADLIVLFRGQVFAVEVKRPGGRQSPAQREFQAAWEQAGGWYMLASSLDDIVRELGE